MSQDIFKKAIELIDDANSEDPNQVTDEDGKMWPKELLYSYRMAEILQRYAPEADSICQLAIRSQHIQRWKSPRNAYPMDRIGYLQWRKDLYKFHADTMGNPGTVYLFYYQTMSELTNEYTVPGFPYTVPGFRID